MVALKPFAAPPLCPTTFSQYCQWAMVRAVFAAPLQYSYAEDIVRPPEHRGILLMSASRRFPRQWQRWPLGKLLRSASGKIRPAAVPLPRAAISPALPHSLPKRQPANDHARRRQGPRRCRAKPSADEMAHAAAASRTKSAPKAHEQPFGAHARSMAKSPVAKLPLIAHQCLRTLFLALPGRRITINLPPLWPR